MGNQVKKLNIPTSPVEEHKSIDPPHTPGPSPSSDMLQTPKLPPSFLPSPESLRIKKVIDLGKLNKPGKLLLNDRTKLVPSTPKLQMIDDKMVRDWNKSKNIDFIDEEDLRSIKREPLENPFLTTKSNTTKPIIKNTIDYSQYNEFINKSTGKKIIKKLNSKQRIIKPKRLFQPKVKLLSDDKEFEIFKD
ncbi:hypothetical protein CLIB1444_04S01002 [[Candida] jaroonii]|uniref:Uncharacterized protein n=1 Tax=[Candida] jaroonii TaxID=467808 RepID=A0ACA9Y668_9ASCO|nr:hypothetical protein CLIB1444_04S01002 [[Candida] jaroonii]